METGRVLERDCIEWMREQPPCSIDLAVTSPPYCVGIAYGEHNDNMEYDQYMAWLRLVWVELYRVMKEHAYVAVNIGRNTEYNTPAHIATSLEGAGFKFYKSIIWEKPQAAATQTAWYKYPNPRYYEPYLVTEDILLYTKGEVKGDYRGEKLDILDPAFVRSVATNVWRIRPESLKVSRGIHPAPFPLEIPANLIQLLSRPGELVYDPFAGSGTTLQAAKELGRDYVGTDIDPMYVDYANGVLMQDSLF